MLQNKLLVTTTLRYCFTYTTRNMWKGRVPPIRPFPLMCRDDMNRGALTTTYCRASSTTRRRRKNRDPGDPAMALHECLQGLRIENFQSMFVLKTDWQRTRGHLKDWTIRMGHCLTIHSWVFVGYWFTWRVGIQLSLRASLLKRTDILRTQTGYRK